MSVTRKNGSHNNQTHLSLLKKKSDLKTKNIKLKF